MLAPGDIPLRRRLCEFGGDGSAASNEQVLRAWALFRELLGYVDAATCRHDFILRYFGDEAESLGGCGRCDVCRAICSKCARRSSGARARERDRASGARGGGPGAGRGGAQAIAEMLRGKSTERVVRYGFDGLSTFGLLRTQSQDEIMRLLRALLAGGFIDLASGDYPTPTLTALGGRVMRAEEPVPFRLPGIKREPRNVRDVRPLRGQHAATTLSDESPRRHPVRSAARTPLDLGQRSWGSAVHRRDTIARWPKWRLVARPHSKQP